MRQSAGVVSVGRGEPALQPFMSQMQRLPCMDDTGLDQARQSFGAAGKCLGQVGP
jgi:hypothetical protein